MIELHCPQCGYDLRAKTAGCCPECGRAYDHAELLLAIHQQQLQRARLAEHTCDSLAWVFCGMSVVWTGMIAVPIWPLVVLAQLLVLHHLKSNFFESPSLDPPARLPAWLSREVHPVFIVFGVLQLLPAVGLIAATWKSWRCIYVWGRVLLMTGRPCADAPRLNDRLPLATGALALMLLLTLNWYWCLLVVKHTT